MYTTAARNKKGGTIFVIEYSILNYLLRLSQSIESSLFNEMAIIMAGYRHNSFILFLVALEVPVQGGP